MQYEETMGTPRFLTPPSGFGISTLRTGCGLYFLVRNCSLMFSPFSERYPPSSSTVMPSTPAAPLFLTTCRYAALRLSLLNICSMRLLVSMRCFLSSPFAFASFEVIDRRYAPATKWNVLQLIDCSALRSIPITGTSLLLWLLLTSHSSLLLRLMRPPVRPPQLRRSIFPLTYPPHLLVLPATFGLHLLLQTYPHFPAFYAVPVRRTKGLLTASFRFHLAVDTLAVQLCVSSLPRHTRDFHPLDYCPCWANKSGGPEDADRRPMILHGRTPMCAQVTCSKN